MASGRVGRADVRAYRFARRQVDWAITHADPLPMSDPGQLPRRWTLVSFFLAVGLSAGFGVYGLIKPESHVQEAPSFVGTSSRSLSVVIGGLE
jgi:hypothetical protein